MAKMSDYIRSRKPSREQNMAMNKLCIDMEEERQRVIDRYVDLRTTGNVNIGFSTASAGTLVNISKAFADYGIIQRGVELDREVRRFTARRGF